MPAVDGSFSNLVRERRAIPHFTDEAVPQSLLTRILGDAAQAPSGYNLQPWRFLVLRSAASRALLRAAAFDQEKITEAPVVIVAFAPHHDWRERMDEIFAESVRRGGLPADGLEKRKRTAERFVDSLPLPVWLNRHTMIAFTHLMLSAEAHGFDTAPMEGFDGEKVKTALHLPLESEVVALLAIGRAREPRPPFPGRLPLSRVAFDERLDTPWPDSE